MTTQDRFCVRQLIILVVAMVSLLNARGQRKYYFSHKSTTEGNGSKLHPFSSLEKLSQLTLLPGDSVFFHAKDTIIGNIVVNNIRGSRNQNIVFTSYGAGRCILNGNNKEAVIINGSSYFQILNLVIEGSGRKTGNTSDGLKFTNCKNFKTASLDISGFQKSGLLLYNCEHAEVNKVFAHENGLAGILIEGDYQKRISKNIRIVDCRADNNPGDPTNLDNHSGNGILAGNCKNVLIEYCTATNNGWDMPRIGNGPVGIWAYEADSVTIQHCISYRNKTAKGAADGGGFDLDGGVTNSTIQYCLSYENWGSGYGIFEYSGAEKWYNNTLRYCISINDGYETDHAAGMFIWNGWSEDSMFSNFYAYNNLFYNDRKYAFSFSDQSRHKKFFFFNNVFIASDTSDIFDGVDSSTSDIFLGNLWMRKNGGFGQGGFLDFKKWVTATGHEFRSGNIVGSSSKKQLVSLPQRLSITDPHSMAANPLLLSLCANVLGNRGIDIRKMFSLDTGKMDFFGHRIPAQGSAAVGVCDVK